MSDGKQATLGGGEADTRDPDDHATNDFGDALDEHETRDGYSRYDVASLLQKAVRRSDEECAAWAAWELVRSGYAWNCWDRLALYAVEDLRAGDEVVLTIDRYERLATERWDTDGWKARLCAIHAALAAARATSTREATYANEFFERVAEERAAAHEADREPADDLPVGDLEPGGEFDVIFDQHTYDGTKMGRDGRYFTVHGGASARPANPNSAGGGDAGASPSPIARTATRSARTLAPVDPDDRWAEPEQPQPDESFSDET